MWVRFPPALFFSSRNMTRSIQLLAGDLVAIDIKFYIILKDQLLVEPEHALDHLPHYFDFEESVHVVGPSGPTQIYWLVMKNQIIRDGKAFSVDELIKEHNQ